MESVQERCQGCGLVSSVPADARSQRVVLTMSKQRLPVGWLTWIIICVFSVWLLSTVWAGISMFFPYDPSQKARSFCDYVLPPIFFVLFVGLGVIGNLRARRDPS